MEGSSLNSILRKTTNLVLVAGVIFSFGATPAFANPLVKADTEETANMQYVAPQGLTTLNEIEQSTEHLDALLELTAIKNGPEFGYDVEAAIALAESEIGTSRATGWSMPGECIMSAQRWIHAGGGKWDGGGTPVTNYNNATRLPLHLAEPGDIIQYEHLFAPHAWVTGIHTVLVTGVNPDGTLEIIQSNAPAGSGLVTKDTSWTPEPPEGFQAVVWRF